MRYLKNQSLLLFVIFIANITWSQQPDELLSKWAAKSPIEKVSLHLDRQHYFAGETIWFKAYLYSEFLPDTISSILHVELRDIITNNIVQENVLPVVFGISNGQIELPDNLFTGNYLVTAYSPSMLNNGENYIFKRQIYIYGKEKSKVPKANINKGVSIEFFPEGGNFVNALNNVVAFKITDASGYPISGSGTIMDDNNNLITSFSVYHQGMGFFEIIPSDNKKYYARLNNNTSIRFELPACTKEGIALSIIPQSNGFYYGIFQSGTNTLKKPAYMVGQMQHQIIFRKTLQQDKKEQNGVINTSNIHSGIMQVTIFNKDGIPLAERLCFVDNKEYLQTGFISTDTINTDAKGRNHFKIRLVDTIRGNLSVSVTDDSFDLNLQGEQNIITDLLLTSDLKGYIHDPARYFKVQNDSTVTELDLLMMTNGWRRFKWLELAKKVDQPLRYKDPEYITISGRINLEGSNRPFTEKQVMAIITAEGMGKSIQFINTDKQGNFKLDSLLFFGKGRILFIDTRGKKSQYIDVVTADDSITKKFTIIPEPALQETANEFIDEKIMKTEYERNLKEAGILLEEVKIKAIQKSPIQKLEDKYTNGPFATNAFVETVIDLVNTDQPIFQNNIFDYLTSRVPGLKVVEPNFSDAGSPDITNPQNDETNYRLYYRQMPSASSLGNQPMTIYLNEVETDAGVIATIPAIEIALIKVYSSFAAASGGGGGGVLAVYTKKGDDKLNTGKMNSITYKGFSVVKEFYTPDYKMDPSLMMKPDNRITLLWRPNIFVNAVSPVIPVSFYNSDRARKFKIVVEGMTTSGKLISIEKIISAN